MTGFSAYGKIPALGDFFRLNASPSFVDPWDTWLQTQMADAAEMNAGQWDALYMSAPIWRFSVSAGLIGTTGWVGVMMPSVDRVGRKFPLTLLAPLADAQASVPAHLGAESTFVALENIALDALEDGYGRDHLEAALATVTGPRPAAAAAVARQGSGITLQAASLFQALCRSDFDILASPSIWSTSNAAGERLMLAQGMPQGAAALALFDADAAYWSDTSGALV